MNNFRTEIKCRKINGKAISHENHTLILGSCFAENIGNKLIENLFKVCCNPFGVLYNPISVLNTLKRIESGRLYTIDKLFFFQELWRSFDHHSSFAHPNQDTALNKINENLQNSSIAFHNSGTIIITFGTSFIYSLKKNGRTVANCHKLPHQQFDRQLVTSEQVMQLYIPFFEKLLQTNPQLQIILTISPVRHLKESSNENQVSKSHLLIAVYELATRFSRIHYFPSYEIMMDNLRDYRFYKPDLVHPNDTAVNYIWNRFRETCISEESNRFIEEYKQIFSAKMHRIQYPALESTKKFISAQLNHLSALTSKYPKINFSSDINYFKSLK